MSRKLTKPWAVIHNMTLGGRHIIEGVARIVHEGRTIDGRCDCVVMFPHEEGRAIYDRCVLEDQRFATLAEAKASAAEEKAKLTDHD